VSGLGERQPINTTQCWEGHGKVKKKKVLAAARTEPDHDNDGVNLEPLVGVTQEAHVSHNQLVKKKKKKTTTTRVEQDQSTSSL
jgi:hypothetical protein